MVNHRDQAKFDRAGWRLKVLLPSWAAQISLLIILIAISAYLFSKAMNQSVEVRGTAIAWESINIGISALSLLLTGYEILKTVTEGLTPKMMLVTNLTKLGGGMLCMIMDGMVTGTSLDGWSDGTLVIQSLLMVSILVSGCYAAWKWKRLAQYDEYHHPGNVKPFGFHADLKPHKGGSGHMRILSDDLDWDPDLETGHNVEIVSSSYPMAPTPGETTPTPTPGRDRGGSTSSSFSRIAGRMHFSLTNDVDAANAQASAVGSDRRSRASSLLALDTAYDPAASRQQLDHEAGDSVITLPKRPASYVSITGTGADRRASYNHTRDPAFDEFVRSRAASNSSGSGSGSGSNNNKNNSSRHVSTGSSASHASSSHSHSHSHTSSTASTTSTTTSLPHSGSNNTTNNSGPAPVSSSSSSSALYRLSLNLKSDVDDALGAAFGWGSHSAATKNAAGGGGSRSSSQSSSSSTSTSLMAGGDPPAIAVGGGAVQGVRSVRDSLGRAPSDGSERAAVGNMPDDDDEEGTEEEEEEEEEARRRRLQNVDEASRALLGEDGVRGGDGAHPELLRPGRPKSEMIEFVITPPPRSPGPGARSTWGNAYAR